MRSVTLVVLSLYVFTSICYCLEVISPATYAGSYIAPAWHWNPTNIAITANVTWADPTNACKSLNNAAQVQGHIAFVILDGCSVETIARNVQAAGGLAGVVVGLPGVAGQWYLTYDGSDRSDITIPMYFTDQNDMTKAANTETLTIVVMPGDYNSWQDMFESATVLGMRIVIGIWSFGILLMSIYIMGISIYVKRKATPKIPLAILTCEILAAVIRLVSLLGNPFGSNTNTTFPAARWFSTLHIPFLLAAEVCVIVFWFQLTKKNPSVKSVKGMSLLGSLKIRIVLAVALGLVFFFEILSNGFAASYYATSEMDIIYGVVYAAYSLTIAIGYLVISTRLVRVLSEVKSVDASGAKIVQRLLFMTNSLRIQAVCMVLAVIGSLGTALPLYNVPGGFFGVWWYLYIIICSVSTIQMVILFPEQKKPADKSTTSTTVSSANTGTTQDSSSAGVSGSGSSSSESV